ncbi:unnamed protein product [Rodentolepis nana]|uniref:MBD domain-containing protein n=1 Tax=Rodentolepis nana TaxID=102285 RepID=A0A158QGJ9_RODNA|nr:unnamed protein product [Rodentolepis nana]
MSIYHSMSNSGQANNTNNNSNGQSSDSNAKNDLTMDYLASIYASNGTLPPSMLQQQSAANSMTQNSATGDIMNAILTAAMAAASPSAPTMDPFTASTLLTSIMYSQQQQQQAQQNSLLQSNARQAQVDPYSSKANIPIDPTHFAQQALLQAGIEASSRQQHQQNNHQHQMALAMANLLGQCTSNPLLALHQRRDLYGEEASTSSSTAGTDESFSSVLAKLTQGLNQSAASGTASSRTPITSQSKTKGISVHTSSGSCGASRYPSQQTVTDATTAVYAAAALSVLQQQQQQNRLTTTPKHQPSLTVPSRPTTASSSTPQREGQLHRGRGRPPKSSISVTKIQVDKQSRASTSTPQSESSIADSNSIDGTITDVLKRFNDSTDQTVPRKRKRVDSVEKSAPNNVSASAARSNTPNIPASSTKTDTLSHKRARTLPENGYRLPLNLGWRRETLVKGVGPGGLLGDVVYIAPCGRQFWNIDNIREYLRSTANTMLTTEDFTFKSYIRLGDYYECNKESEGFVKMSDSAVNALIATGQETQSGGPRRKSQPVYPSAAQTLTPAVSTGSNTKAALGENSNAEMMAALGGMNPEACAKTFAELALGLQRFPPQMSSTLVNQIGSVWTPWPVGLQAAAISSSSSTSGLQFPSSQGNHPHQQPKERPSYPALTNSIDDFNDIRGFFKKLVEDLQRLESEKESLRKADLEAQSAKAREERITYLVEEELRRPVEDLNLLNPKPLPDYDPIEGNQMPSQVFTDCLFVLEFLHAFTEVLCIDPESIPSMRCLQAAFIERDETCLEVVNHLIIELLKFAILDPGIPTPRLVTQILNARFSEMEVNTHTVTGLLRVLLIGRNSYEDEMSDWLAPSNVDHIIELSGPQIASLLAFICDELACSSRIISNEVDRTIELQVALKRDKFNLEAKIRKIRVILARKFGLDHTIKPKGSEEEKSPKQPAFLHNIRQLSSLHNYDSGDEEELESADELEKRIESLQQCLEAKQRAIEECAFRLSGVFLGQDRFHRNYFVMGSLGGIYVEGQPTSNRVGFASHDIPAVFDADAIVAEIKARRELSVTRHFNTNPGNSSNTASVAQKFTGMRSAAPKVERLTSEKSKEPEVKPEETFEVKSEQYSENMSEMEEPKVKKLLDEATKVNEDRIEPNDDRTDIEAKEPGESNREDSSLKDEGEKLTIKTLNDSEEKVVLKINDSEESSTSQPLDLSTKRPTPPPPPSPPPQPQLKTPTPVPSPIPPMSDQTLWQSLTEQDLSWALEVCQMDDTFITTATLLFITQNDLIDRASIINCWSDPSWHMQLFFYKLQLMKSIAFEKKKSCEENNSLTQSLKRLKTLLDENSRENRVDVCHQAAKDIQLNEEELITVVEEMLGEKGIQKAGPEDLASIPQEAKGNWWRVRGSQNLQKLLAALHSRGIRERSLLQIIQTAEDAIVSSIDADASTVLDIESITSEDGWKPSLLRVRSRRGKGRGVNASTSSFLNSPNTGASSSVNLPVLSHSTRHIPSLPNLDEAASEIDACAFRGDNDASPTFTLERSVFLGENFERAMRAGRGSETTQQSEAEQEFVDECRFLELVEGLVDRVLSASLQTKGWQAPMKATEDDSIQLVPRNSPKIYRYDFWPLELARERLLDLEAHTERRYLLPPLNCESRLDAVQAQAAAATQDERQAADKMKIADGTGSVCSDSTNQEESHTRNRGDANNETESGIDSDAQGLTLWRRNTRKADSIVELKRCAMQFEAAIAWDKSIMKVLCQICRRDKNEARLLLCDGCDHGFHTYCFRPPMISIPEGDWFCYDCVSKAMGKCHCFVCGLTRPIGENSCEGAPTNNVAPAHRLVQCVSCSRGAHPACLRPPVNRLPKKWTCMLCTTNGAHVGSREKNIIPTATTSAAFSESDAKMSQANSMQLDRPKRVYIKSGAYRSTKRIARIVKPDSTKIRTASSSSTSERKVGRPKGSKRGLKKRGRPSSQSKRHRTDADTIDPNDTSADEDEEMTDGEYQDEDGTERKGEGGNSVDKEEALENSEGEENGGGEEGEDSTNSGVTKSRKNLSPGIPSTVVVIRRPRKNKKKRLNGADREFCRNATEDLMKHELSWPFRKPVCCKTVPIYRRIIKRPMDLSTILKRLVSEKSHHYSSLREWREDVRQIFTNCRIFNEDESEIGKAGHELRKYFESTWATVSQERSPASTEMPVKEESIITAPSSPESSNFSAKPASEVDDVPSISPAEASAIPPLSSMESEDVSPSPNSKEPIANEEEEQKTESPCAEETAVESVLN